MDGRKHILFLCSWFPNRVHPTLGNFIQRHAEAIQSKHHVTVLFAITDPRLNKPYEIEHAVEQGVSIIRIYIPTLSPIKKWSLYFKLLKKCYDELPLKVDLVHLNQVFHLGFFALYLKQTKGIPFVISEHWTGYHQANRKAISPLKLKYCQFIANQAVKTLPVSHDLANSMREIGIKTPYIKVPNVVDTDLFTPQKKESVGISKFLHVSTLKDEHKNISGILDVIQRCQNQNLPFEFTICGDGDTGYILKKQNELQIPSTVLTVVGEQPLDKIAELMRQHDAFILFSNYENLPCVILEAFSSGIPVVSTNVGGIKENFPKFAGELINKGSVDELFDVLNAFHLKPEKFDQSQIRDYAVQNFSVKAIASAFDCVYQDVIK